MPSILIAPYEAEAMRHIRDLCARGFHVTGVADKIAVEDHPASIEIRYEAGDRRLLKRIAEMPCIASGVSKYISGGESMARYGHVKSDDCGKCPSCLARAFGKEEDGE